MASAGPRTLASPLASIGVPAEIKRDEQRVALNPARRMRIKSDLDRLWRERGAQHTREGLYLLEPQVLVRSDFSQVVSSKRAQAKRRSEVLLQALSAVDDVVRGLRLRPAVRMQEH